MPSCEGRAPERRASRATSRAACVTINVSLPGGRRREGGGPDHRLGHQRRWRELGHAPAPRRPTRPRIAVCGRCDRWRRRRSCARARRCCWWPPAACSKLLVPAARAQAQPNLDISSPEIRAVTEVDEGAFRGPRRVLRLRRRRPDRQRPGRGDVMRAPRRSAERATVSAWSPRTTRTATRCTPRSPRRTAIPSGSGTSAKPLRVAGSSAARSRAGTTRTPAAPGSRSSAALRPAMAAATESRRRLPHGHPPRLPAIGDSRIGIRVAFLSRHVKCVARRTGFAAVAPLVVRAAPDAPIGTALQPFSRATVRLATGLETARWTTSDA